MNHHEPAIAFLAVQLCQILLNPSQACSRSSWRAAWVAFSNSKAPWLSINRRHQFHAGSWFASCYIFLVRSWQHKGWLLVLLQLHGSGHWIDWHCWKSTGDCNPNLDIVLCVNHFGNEVVKESRTCAGPFEEQFFRSIYWSLYAWPIIGNWSFDTWTTLVTFSFKDLVLYNTLIGTCSSASDWQPALELLCKQDRSILVARLTSFW